MIEFNDVTYQQVAEELLRHIGDSDYFSGTVTLTVPEFESRLKTSVIVYRGSSTSDSALRYVEDFVPVWWECHTFTSDGEVVNDFSFSELRNFLVGGGRVHRE